MSRGRQSLRLALQKILWSFVDLMSECLESLLDFIESFRQQTVETELPPGDGGDPPVQPTEAQKFYAVAVGRIPGIYTSWYEAQKQVNGFSGNFHKRFTDREEAEEFMRLTHWQIHRVYLRNSSFEPANF